MLSGTFRHGLLRLDKHDVDLAAELNELRELFELRQTKQERTITVEGGALLPEQRPMLRRAFNGTATMQSSILPITPVQRYTLSVTVFCVNNDDYEYDVRRFPLIWNVCFDRFYRADSSKGSTTRKARGLGLSVQGRSFMLAAASCQQNNGAEIVFKSAPNGLIRCSEKTRKVTKLSSFSHAINRAVFIVFINQEQRDNTITGSRVLMPALDQLLSLL